MNSKTVKALISGSVAAVLALGISLPSQADAASAQTSYNGTITYDQIVNFWKEYYNQNGSGAVKTTVPVTVVSPAKPAAGTSAGTGSAESAGSTGASAGTGSQTKPSAGAITPSAGTTTPSAGTTTPSTGTTTAASDSSAYVKEVVSLVNAERAKAGLAPLKALDSLNKVAAAKATDMRSNNYFSHTSPTYGSPFDMMKSFGVNFGYAGENIAMGQKTPQEVMTAWMNSAGHKANILSKNFDSIGVGFDNNYWVQEFTGN
ncbi:hypothetical protein PSTEL_17160 [Paenibacillus stellifer]|uniref:SCP domain-containing protein n=1 Tax=Paenibacillus stellifer TaxID=169760 RepID=A0A089LSQ0_9BACL|nr:CAP domain-containing protein [Paenibacillus stellifer]AIQ64571.1 hypothetical protein PSTEL_17160 [Paenibacillus stellifer]